jgi:hypothetical protein
MDILLTFGKQDAPGRISEKVRITEIGAHQATSCSSFAHVSERFLSNATDSNIPITTHCPLFASDLRKAEYAKNNRGCELRLPVAAGYATA